MTGQTTQTTQTTQPPQRRALAELQHDSPFRDRHIGTTAENQAKMLAALGRGSVEDLVAAAVPSSIRMQDRLGLDRGRSEADVLAELRALAAHNRPMVQMIGLGYHDTVTPPVILRNVLESPAWYTAYTPYQPEISQGRLEALLNFQTVIADLTGLPTANASLLDESTAGAEAMTLSRRSSKSTSNVFVVDADAHPQTIGVIQTRAEPLGIEVKVADLSHGLPAGETFGVLVQYPGSSGAVRNYAALVEDAHARGALVTFAADPLALTLLTPPGELGADVAVGSSQRFGVPPGFGGPHAGYISVRAGLQRSLPVRLVGVSVDRDGRTACRLAVQPRPQDLRRGKA